MQNRHQKVLRGNPRSLVVRKCQGELPRGDLKDKESARLENGVRESGGKGKVPGGWSYWGWEGRGSLEDARKKGYEKTRTKRVKNLW